ncbi:hypothetical protein [Streptomyces sp. JB150]|uniref:hypothetical protein n=1 Tax=Streptomyces sp. JB150 TaxID=2714844 RepID=UPI001407525D|nr:hypothetical protein [Streptomyces sp. JB150]QIJ65390.1 hypothetical protein G7Z13_27645 [Streptomyces sp. JB150]
MAADADKFRWPDPALFALTLGALFLISAVHGGVLARGHLYSRGDVEQWWGPLSEMTESRRERLISDQRADFDLWRSRSTRANLLYNLGVLCLAVGSGLALVPPHGTATPVWRWLAAGTVAAFCGLAVLSWTARLVRGVVDAWAVLRIRHSDES